MTKSKKGTRKIRNKTRKNFVKLQNEPKTDCKVASYDEFIKLIDHNGDSLVKYKSFTKKILKNKSSIVSAKNDFYSYINNKWLHNKEIYNTTLSEGDKYIIQLDDFRIIQNKVFYEMDDIINDYIQNNRNKTSKCMSNFYKSGRTNLTVNLAKQKIEGVIEYLDEMRKDKKNIWKILAYINSDETIKSKGPFIWNVVQDRKNSTKFISEISPKIFAVINMESYYINNKDRQDFTKYVNELFKIINFNHDRPEDVFDIGIELFNCFSYNEFKNDPDGYNLIHKNEALKKYGFDWITFTKELGYKTTPEYFVATDINYLKACSKLITENWNSDKWRPWWVWLITRKIFSRTNQWNKVYYNFYGEKQRGEMGSYLSIKSAILTCLAFNTTLSKIYIEKNLNNKKIAYVKGFIEDLKNTFIKIIGNNKWMEKKTTEYALQKLKHLNFIVGSVDYLEEDALLDYKEDDIDYNIKLLMYYRTKDYIRLDGNKFIFVPSLDWDEYPPKFNSFQCYQVNAKYIPTLNAIYIPLGYIQEPFIDLEKRGIEYNLSNIGFTIAHEMAHSLDDLGSKYDLKGNLKDWWSPEDKKKYKKIQKDILNQYESWAKRDHIKYDASLTIGEDIADITAINICDTYLLYYLHNTKSLAPIINNSFNTFHIYFANQQKQKVSKMAEKSQLILNPHPPNKYRCNVPLSRSMSFIANYDIKKGDGMWWSNQEPVW